VELANSLDEGTKMSTSGKIETLLTSDEIASNISHLACQSTEILVLSAFFTAPGYAWLSKHKNLAKIKLVVRAAPNDVASGACDLDAILEAMRTGWEVRFISNLHAKIFLIGDHVVVGSANLTANGLALNEHPNLELNTVISASDSIKQLLFGIFDQAHTFTENLILDMQSYISAQEIQMQNMSCWPDSIVSNRCRNLYCIDLPLSSNEKDPRFSNEPWKTIQVQILSGDIESALYNLRKTFAFLWLTKILKQNDGEVYFGRLSAILHSELADDPAPYRSDVKSLLSNFLGTISEIRGAGIEVTRPRHSQRVRLVD
jgi:HKD family nuclease